MLENPQHPKRAEIIRLFTPLLSQLGYKNRFYKCLIFCCLFQWIIQYSNTTSHRLYDFRTFFVASQIKKNNPNFVDTHLICAQHSFIFRTLVKIDLFSRKKLLVFSSFIIFSTCFFERNIWAIISILSGFRQTANQFMNLFCNCFYQLWFAIM